VSGTSCQLLAEDITTYQERIASHLKKILQDIRNILHVTEENITSYQECLTSYLTKILQQIPGTSFKLFEEDLTTYQDRRGNYLQKILLRIRKVLQIT
jgi:predicted PurR-regulated permease PerM